MSIYDRDYMRQKEFDYIKGEYVTSDKSKKKNTTYNVSSDGSINLNTRNSKINYGYDTGEKLSHTNIIDFTFIDFLKFITPLVFFFILIVYALIKLFER